MFVMFAIAAIMLFISAASTLVMLVFSVKYGMDEFTGICLFIFIVVIVYLIHILMVCGGM